MMWVRSYLPVMALTVFLASNAYAQPYTAGTTSSAANTQDRVGYVQYIAQRVLAIVKTPEQTLSQKKHLLEQEFLRTVNTQWRARHVAGKTWDSASPNQQQHYTQLYARYLINTYMSALNEQTEKNLVDITIMGIDEDYDDAFMVHTKMVMTNGSNTAVDFVVQEAAGQRHIIDIVLSGVSMLRTHRAELGDLAASKGMDGTIARLEQIVNAPAPITLSMRE